LGVGMVGHGVTSVCRWWPMLSCDVMHQLSAVSLSPWLMADG
jgi:hypothetical protein